MQTWNSLAVQWLGLSAFTAEGQGPGSIPGQGTRMPQATQRGQKKTNNESKLRSKRIKKHERIMTHISDAHLGGGGGGGCEWRELHGGYNCQLD